MPPVLYLEKDLKMNKYCVKGCKHSSYCNLNFDDTANCKNSDSELDKSFGYTVGSIFGRTTKEIAEMQGIKGLKI